MMELDTIFCGDALDVLRTLPDNSVHCCITSPPYYALRDYGAEGQTFSYKTWENVAISLAGSYQIKNAALALEGVEALRKLGYALSDQQVREGLLHTAWRGRFTTLRYDPTVIIDGAHNPAAALELKESLERYFPGKTLCAGHRPDRAPCKAHHHRGDPRQSPCHARPRAGRGSGKSEPEC